MAPIYPDNLWTASQVEHRLSANPIAFKVALEHLTNGFVNGLPLLRRLSCGDGLQHWIFWNPPLPVTAVDDLEEPHGLILLVAVPKNTGQPAQWDFGLLQSTLADLLVLPADARWQQVKHFLDRMVRVRDCRPFPEFTFGVILPQKFKRLTTRKRTTLAFDFASAGATFLASQFESRLALPDSTPRSFQFKLRPEEDITLEISRRQIRIVFVEDFNTIRDRVLASWICTRISKAKRQHNTHDSAVPRWRICFELEPPKSTRKGRAAVHVTWVLQKPMALDLQTFNVIVSLLAASFRPFLVRSIAELRHAQDRELAHCAEMLCRPPGG